MIKPDEAALLKTLVAEWGSHEFEKPAGARTFLEIAESLGMPYKRARSIAHKWDRQGFYEWGVSWRVGWFCADVPLSHEAAAGEAAADDHLESASDVGGLSQEL